MSEIPKSVHKDIINSDNERISQYYHEFIADETLNLNLVLGAYKFLQFILKHE